MALLGETMSVRRGKDGAFEPPTDEVPTYSVFRSQFVSPNEVWVQNTAADDRVVMHWNGAWTHSLSYVGSHVVGLWAFGSGEAWAVAGNQILHRTPAP